MLKMPKEFAEDKCKVCSQRKGRLVPSCTKTGEKGIVYVDCTRANTPEECLLYAQYVVGKTTVTSQTASSFLRR